MSTHRPTWLTEPCPPWCSGDHSGQDHPADRYHQSPEVFVPVVVPARGYENTASEVSLERKPEAAEFSVVALRPVDDPTRTWLAVVGERQFIEVTAESAARLHDALGALLSQLRSDS